MMTLKEIENANINVTVAREAYTQASQRLGDTLDTKKVYEQKAFTLFNGYVTLSLALFGIGGAAFKQQGLARLVLPFWIAGLLYLVGAVFFVLSLIDATYGALASSPDMWLNKGTIDGDDSVVGLMLAYITFYHQERIDTSVARNKRKALLIRIGIILGIVGPLVLAILVASPKLTMWLEALLRQAT